MTHRPYPLYSFAAAILLAAHASATTAVDDLASVAVNYNRYVAIDVLTNDTIDGDPTDRHQVQVLLTYPGPQHGFAIVFGQFGPDPEHPTNSIGYIPNQGDQGPTDEFGYSVIDGSHVVSGTVRIAFYDNYPALAADAAFPGHPLTAEPTIAQNPIDTTKLAVAAADLRPFFDGRPQDRLGITGIATSADGGRTWTYRGVLSDQPSWHESQWRDWADVVMAYGPRPHTNGHGFSWDNGARLYIVSLAFDKDIPFSPRAVQHVTDYTNTSEYKEAGIEAEDDLYGENFGSGPETLNVVTAYSDDNGATWSAPLRVNRRELPGSFHDKPYMTADTTPSSPFFGNLYVAWDEFETMGFTTEGINVITSTDGGDSFPTSAEIQKIGDVGLAIPGPIKTFGGYFPGVAVDSFGDVYVAYFTTEFTCNGLPAGGPNVCGGDYTAIGVRAVNKSKNGGKSFSREYTKIPPPPHPFPSWFGLSAPLGIRSPQGLISLVADPTPGTRTLYFATEDGKLAYLAKSTDGAVTWTNTLISTNIRTGVDISPFGNNRCVFRFCQDDLDHGTYEAALLPTVSVAPNGRVDFCYQKLTVNSVNALFDSVLAPGREIITDYCAYQKAGQAWTRPLKVGPVANPDGYDIWYALRAGPSLVFIGDYVWAVSDNDRIYYVHGDTSPGTFDGRRYLLAEQQTVDVLNIP